VIEQMIASRLSGAEVRAMEATLEKLLSSA
jgi:hypothetical protein